MINDKQTIKGMVASWKLFDIDGNVKEEGTGHNLITTAGKTLLAERLAGTSAVVMTHMAIGSDTTAPAITNTALGSELARVALTSTTPSTNTVTYVGTFPAGTGTGTVGECGLFSASTAGTMLSRSLAVSLTKGASDSLVITWTITFS